MKPTLLLVALLCTSLLGAQGFTNIASDIGVAYSFGDPDYGGGVSFADFNQDGWDDLTYTSGPGSPMRFHINTGGGYEEITAPVNNTTETKQPIWVDYDNDGDLDLYVTSYQLNRLYRNDGNLTMIDVTASCGFDDPLNQSFNATWFDYDRDGYLDLMTAHRYSHLVGNLTLYHNLGNGNFEDVTIAAGVGNGMGNSVLAMASLDFNNDGWQDVYVGQDYQQGNLLLKNMGDGTFVNIAASSNTNIENNTMTVAVGDFNNDGWMDLFVTDTGYDGCSMLVNNGDETFDDVATPMNTVLHEFTWGAVYLDADNDMDLDLHVDGKNNSPWSSYMFENPGGGNPFGIVNESWGFGTDNARSIGCAIGDYDGDGYPELAKNCSFTTINTFWRNDFSAHHYLSIDLVGVESNVNAVGAVVWVTSGGVTQVRRVGCGEGFSSQNSYTQFFGLGDNESADEVTVWWPSGIVTTTCLVPADQRITLYEVTETCNDESACNYDPEGTTDVTCTYPEPMLDCDGNCLEDADGDLICDALEIPGCLDESACNYNADATDAADCTYAQPYLDCEGNCLSDIDGDNVCDELEVGGCMDTEACNYDNGATDDDGSCSYLSNYEINGPTSYNILEATEQQFTYPATAGSSYLWTTALGTITSGQGTAQVSVSYMLTGTDQISVVETNEAGCVSETAVHTIDLLETAMAEMAIAQPMFYPNPTSGTITFTNSTSMTPVVQITDVSGRIIDTLLVSAQRQVHLTHLPAGYYLIRFGTQTASLMLVGK